MYITRDGFIWLLVTGKAKEVYNTGLFELYAIHEDESENLIESFDELQFALGLGYKIGIEVGHLHNSKS